MSTTQPQPDDDARGSAHHVPSGSQQGASQHPGYEQLGHQQPGHLPPGYQPPGHQQGYQPGFQQGYRPGAAPPMSPDSERTWAIAAHLSSFVAAYVALGFLGPLVCMLVIGDRSPYARRQAVEALNFNLSWLIYIVVAGLLSIILIGIPFLILLAIAYLVLVIVGAVAASRGEEYRYPLTLRMVT